MNLKEEKSRIEELIKNKIKAAIQDEVELATQYDITNDVVTVIMLQKNLCYAIQYNNAEQKVSMSAEERQVEKDNFGVSAIKVKSIVITEDFMSDIKAVIKTALEEALNSSEETVEVEIEKPEAN